MEEPVCPIEYIAVKEEFGEDIKCNLEDLHRSINITTETPETTIKIKVEDVQSSIDVTSDPPYELGVQSGNDKFTCSSQLPQHARIHSVGLIAKLKNRLKVHLSAGTCEISNYKCAKTTSLSKRSKVFSVDKPFACELCAYKCSIKQSMTRHMKTHTSAKPFLCEICDYKCSIKQYLKKHMKTHSNDKPFTCAICLFKSAHKDALRSHLKVHTGKARVCSIP